MHELALRVAGGGHEFGVHLERPEEFNALLPYGIRLSHGYPDVRVKEVAALDAGLRVVRNGNASTGFFGNFSALSHKLRGGLEGLRGHNPHVHSHFCATDKEAVAHVEAGVTKIGVGHLPQGLVHVLAHGEEVGQDLCGMELVGEAVPYGNA